MRHLLFAPALFFFSIIGCAVTVPPASETGPSETATGRSESAAPPGGAECGDRTCGVDELCVPQGFCSGIRPPETPVERAVTYTCVRVSPECARDPSCGCVGNPCRYGGCAYVTHGVVQCICA